MHFQALTQSTFTRLIESYDLPYLDTLRLLPKNMVRPLRKQTAHALSPDVRVPIDMHILNAYT